MKTKVYLRKERAVTEKHDSPSHACGEGKMYHSVSEKLPEHTDEASSQLSLSVVGALTAQSN